MSGFELVSVDDGTSVLLPEGETQLGRGPFLGISDKRVSRHHGLLQVQEGVLRIKPTHQNPCFFQPSPEDPPEPLEKDRWHTLQPGHLFSLLPQKYVYRVKPISSDNTQRNSQPLEEEESARASPLGSPEPCKDAPCSPDLNGQSKPTVNLTQNPQTRSKPTCSWENEENINTQPNAAQEQVAAAVIQQDGASESPKPEQKKRVLPAWMMQNIADVSSTSTPTGDKKRGRGRATGTPSTVATPTKAKQARPKKARNRTVSSEESGQSDVEQAPKKRAKKMSSDEEQVDEANSKTATASAVDARKPARPSSVRSDEESNDTASAVDARKPARPGSVRSDEESNEADPEWSSERNGGSTPRNGSLDGKKRGGGQKESQSQGRGRGVGREAAEGRAAGPGPSQPKAPPRTPCPYGKDCYRKNPVHFQECSHPGDADYVDGEDEEEEDDNRPECPYGTSCYRKNPQHKKEYKHTQDKGRKARLEDDGEEEDVDDDDSFINDDSEDGDGDSDYVPPESDDSAGEDIKRLKKEAKAFVTRRR